MVSCINDVSHMINNLVLSNTTQHKVQILLPDLRILQVNKHIYRDRINCLYLQLDTTQINAQYTYSF